MSRDECDCDEKTGLLPGRLSRLRGSVVGLLSLYLGSCFVRTFGDSLFEMAVVWHIMRETGSTTTVGAIAAAIQLPVTLAAPLAGVLADRWSRKAMIVYSRIARAAVVSCTLVLYWVGVLSPWHLMAIGVCDSFVQVVGGAAGTGVIPNLVGRDKVVRANAWAEGLNELAPILAGGLGGLVIAAIGIAGAAGITSTLFLVSGLVLTLIAPARFGGGHAAGRPLTARTFLRELWEGVATLLRNRAARTLIVIAVLANLVVSGPIFVLMPFYAAEVLQVDASGYGYLRAALVAGMLVGVLIVGRLGSRLKIGKTVCTVLVLIGAMFAILEGARSLWLASCLWAIIGATLPVLNIPLFSALQLSVPDATRARTMTAFMALAGSTTPVSYAVIGPVAEGLGYTGAYLAGGAALVVLGAAAWTQRKHLEFVEHAQ